MFKEAISGPKFAVGLPPQRKSDRHSGKWSIEKEKSKKKGRNPGTDKRPGKTSSSGRENVVKRTSWKGVSDGQRREQKT